MVRCAQKYRDKNNRIARILFETKDDFQNKKKIRDDGIEYCMGFVEKISCLQIKCLYAKKNASYFLQILSHAYVTWHFDYIHLLVVGCLKE